MLFVTISIAIFAAIAPAIARHIAEWNLTAFADGNARVVRFMKATTFVVFRALKTSAFVAQVVAVRIFWVASLTEANGHTLWADAYVCAIGGLAQ